MGVVHHASYLVFCEVGRTDYMREQGLPYARMEGQGVRLPVVDVGFRFRAPARYDDEILVRTWLTAVTAVRIRFEYRLERDDGVELARGHTTLASVDESGRPCRLPRPVRATLDGLVEQGPGGRVDA